MKKILLILCFIASFGFLYAQQGGGFNQEEIRSFQSSGPFLIVEASYEMKNSLIGAAKGRYDFEGYTSNLVAPNQYEVNIRFVKKGGGWMRYSHTVKLYLMNDGKKLWVKFPNQKVAQYLWSQSSTTIDETPSQTTISANRPTVVIDTEGLYLVLQH